MPYRGKPSAGCGECRKRRSRCDRGIPSCGQCIKTNRQCPGYRNATDLMFHDQSIHVVKKITGSTAFVLEKPAPRQACAAPKMPSCVMYPSLEQLGVNFFMSDLVAGDPNLSQLYYIPSYYAKTGYAHPGLHYSITATGLASYARATGRREIVEHATKSYINAVRGINAALSNPKTAAHDSTLLCINLAAMFEVLAAPAKEGQNNCMKHMEGAVTVALLHVKQGRQTDVTQKILSTMIQGFIVYAWLNNTPLPTGFTELQGYTTPGFYGAPLQYTCLTCMKNTVDFRSGLHTGTYKDPMSIIRKSIELDSAWQKFMTDMPPDTRFEVFRISIPGVEHLVYEGYFHHYPNAFLTHMWNVARTASIHIQRVILKQCHQLLSTPLTSEAAFAHTQRAASETKITASTIEMAATIPQLCGYMDQLLDEHDNATADTDSPSPDETWSREKASSRESSSEPGLGSNITTESMGLAPHKFPTKKHAAGPKANHQSSNSKSRVAPSSSSCTQPALPHPSSTTNLPPVSIPCSKISMSQTSPCPKPPAVPQTPIIGRKTQTSERIPPCSEAPILGTKPQTQIQPQTQTQTQTQPPPQPPLTVGPPPTGNIYHVLFQLYHLRKIRHLPAPLKEWIKGRIEWVESFATPEGLAQQALVSERFWPI